MGKDETIADLISAREKIIALAQTLPAEKRDEVFLGMWATTDLLAHLVGWDFANIDSVNDIRGGQPPRVFQHYDEDWAGFNAQLVAQYRQEDWEKMLDAIQQSHSELIRSLEKIPADDFEKDFGVRSPRGRNIAIAVHLQAEIDDEQIHYQQMVDWLNKEPDA